jgi:hypothetical protein
MIDDPLWALAQQIQADVQAIVAVASPTKADGESIENLKNFLVITSIVEGRPTTREEAELSATTLRQFITRRDVAGARAWAKLQPH